MFTKRPPPLPDLPKKPEEFAKEHKETSINDLSFLELKAFHEHVGAVLTERATQARQTFREDFLSKLTDYGMSLDDFKPEPPKKERKKREVKAKYRHHETGEEWSGRGRTPIWLQALLAEGRQLDEFLIETTDTTIA